MSKKLTLSLSDKNRPNLSVLFHSYIKNRKARKRNLRDIGGGILVDVDDEEYSEILAFWDATFPGWDDDEEMIYPPLNERSKRKEDVYRQYWDQEEREDRWARNLMGKSGRKKKHKRHSKKAKFIDLHKPMDGYIGDDDYNLDDIHYENYSHPKITFYPDYHDRDDKIEFRTILEFSDFCQEKGYFVPGYIIDDIAYRSENHCCLNPYAKESGELEIISEASYGELFYEVCKPEELQ